jgi:hypothetical protein
LGTSDVVSMGIMSDGNSYNIAGGINYSFPVKCTGNWNYETVSGLEIDAFSKEKMEVTQKELLDEKAEALA